MQLSTGSVFTVDAVLRSINVKCHTVWLRYLSRINVYTLIIGVNFSTLIPHLSFKTYPNVSVLHLSTSSLSLLLLSDFILNLQIDVFIKVHFTVPPSSPFWMSSVIRAFFLAMPDFRCSIPQHVLAFNFLLSTEDYRYLSSLLSYASTWSRMKDCLGFHKSYYAANFFVTSLFEF